MNLFLLDLSKYYLFFLFNLINLEFYLLSFLKKFFLRIKIKRLNYFFLLNFWSSNYLNFLIGIFVCVNRDISSWLLLSDISFFSFKLKKFWKRTSLNHYRKIATLISQIIIFQFQMISTFLIKELYGDVSFHNVLIICSFHYPFVMIK